MSSIPTSLTLSTLRAARAGILPALALLALALGCSEDEPERVSCAGSAATCGDTCQADADCPTGLYCEAGACQQDCVPGELSCANLAVCSERGRCLSSNAFEPDASMGPTQQPNPQPQPQVGPSDICADTVVTASRTKPKVILIVDQSGSMDQGFQGGQSRWLALRDFLLEQGGLIDSLQDVVQFGLAMYSARSAGNGALPDGECPIISTVPPALDNLGPIQDVYGPADPIDETPTGDAIDAIIDELGLDMVEADTVPDPTVFILATDGEPDQCEQLNPQDGQEEAIAAVTRAHGLGIRTFVISVGNDVSEQHQQDIANAGLGRQAGDPDAEFWVAGDTDSLAQALMDIVGGQLSCEIQLDGRIEGGDACLGTVTLDAEPLPCNDDNGWQLEDEQHIRLMGEACDRLKAGNARVEASFPCQVDVAQVM